MSSRLLKSFNVKTETGRIVVGVPAPSPVREVLEVDNLAPQPETGYVDIGLELEKEREAARIELEEWRNREQEQFLIQLEEEKRRGYQEGYQLGIEDGRNDAKVQYASELQKAASILELAYQEKEELIREAEPFVLELAIDIAKKVLQQELKTDPDTLTGLIKQTLADVYETDSVSIGVAPEDFPFVQKQRKQLLAVDNGQVEVKIFPDYSVEQGGCIIRTSSGSIDARLDMQLSEIKKALLSYQQEVRISE
ncbi:FliH/SctL family protein [Neobacillus sp. YIM B06451]|uniref:FliH/SctL family protein n=1 Tax=Neobacillus sp. YIM B06451 TaxID=3070994 RepID=UPI00292FB840|nr:FliH/SctL family protein [Neobacillus sp. YIM B06451]